MPSRRKVLIGVGAVLAGSAATTAGILSDSATPSADFRIIAAPGIILVPGRDDHAHVTVDSAGDIDQVTSIDITTLGQTATTTLAHIVEAVNTTEQSIDGLYFKLTAESDDADPADIEGALSIAADGDSIPATGETNYLEVATADGADGDVLEPGEAVAFGLAIDLRPSNHDTSLRTLPDPETFTVTLELSFEPAA